MTVKLTVRSAIWRSHVARTAAEVDGLVPVVKGNGYGFGRAWLAGVAAEFADTVAVGTIHELDGLPPELTVVVLTPTLVPPRSTGPILTVGRAEHVAALEGWYGRVTVKLTSAMQRYGSGAELIETCLDVGLDVAGVSIHPPLAGSATDHVNGILASTERLDPAVPIWLSHIDAATYAALPAGRTYRLRLGTQLWHGDKSALHLGADVLDVRSIAAGAAAGYRLGVVPTDGHLVMIGAGTANGVAPLPDGRSPFHFDQHRLALHEPPHMHTSMAFVPAGDPFPGIGDWVDVQRPLTMTAVDVYEWL
ncbi:MAG: alanine racemase [Ilumatobacteraceae bacterium]